MDNEYRAPFLKLKLPVWLNKIYFKISWLKWQHEEVHFVCTCLLYTGIISKSKLFELANKFKGFKTRQMYTQYTRNHYLN